MVDWIVLAGVAYVEIPELDDDEMIRRKPEAVLAEKQTAAAAG